MLASAAASIAQPQLILRIEDRGIARGDDAFPTAEAGTHDELLALGGRYKSLYESQFVS